MVEAGAFVGGALRPIREENRGDFEDHTRWSEEAQSRANERGQHHDSVAPSMSGALSSRGPGHNSLDKKKKTVVIVVSSLSPADSDEFASEHAVRIPSHCQLSFSLIDAVDSIPPSRAR